MGTFRPAFRSVAQSLTDVDLILVEEAFERLLLVNDGKKKKTFFLTLSLNPPVLNICRIMIECLVQWVYQHVYGDVLVKYIKAIKSLLPWSIYLSINSERYEYKNNPLIAVTAQLNAYFFLGASVYL
jgi:hypothetical protein